MIIGDARFTSASSGEGNPVWLAASFPGVSFAVDTVKIPADSRVISKIRIVGNPARCIGG